MKKRILFLFALGLPLSFTHQSIGMTEAHAGPSAPSAVYLSFNLTLDRLVYNNSDGVDLTKAYVSLYSYDEAGAESVQVLGRAPNFVNTPPHLNPAKLAPGMNTFALFITDSHGKKLGTACLGSIQFDVLLKTNLTINAVITNNCIQDGSVAYVGGNISFDSSEVSLDPSHHAYRLLLETKTKAGQIVRSRIVDGFTELMKQMSQPSSPADIAQLAVPYMVDPIWSGIYVLSATIIDENGNRIYTGSFGGTPSVKFYLDAGDRPVLNFTVGK